MDFAANQPIVLDNGSGSIKAGFAGDEQPKSIFPSIVGRTKHDRVMAGALDSDFYVGSKAQELRGLLRLNYPMEHGIVNDWYVFFSNLYQVYDVCSGTTWRRFGNMCILMN